MDIREAALARDVQQIVAHAKVYDQNYGRADSFARGRDLVQGKG